MFVQICHFDYCIFYSEYVIIQDAKTNITLFINLCDYSLLSSLYLQYNISKMNKI